MEKEDIPYINQLIETLEQTMDKLEEYYNEKDYKKFNETKKFAIIIQKKIGESLNE